MVRFGREQHGKNKKFCKELENVLSFGLLEEIWEELS